VFFDHGIGRQFVELTFGDKNGRAYGFALGDVGGDSFPDIAMARSGAPNVLCLSGRLRRAVLATAGSPVAAAVQSGIRARSSVG
jgi:hypothetical protein